MELCAIHLNMYQEFEKVIITYLSRIKELGYGDNAHVYSYRSYLQSKLDTK